MIKILNNKAFILIEIILYIGIFSLIMSGILISIYSLIESNNLNQTKAMVQTEGSFLIGKIDWTLSGIKKINSPNINSNLLSVTKYDLTIEDPIIITVEGNIMSIKKGSSEALDLNNSNTTISCPLSGCFKHEVQVDEEFSPESIEANIIVNTKTGSGRNYSQNFSTVKYLRK